LPFSVEKVYTPYSFTILGRIQSLVWLRVKLYTLSVASGPPSRLRAGVTAPGAGAGGGGGGGAVQELPQQAQTEPANIKTPRMVANIASFFIVYLLARVFIVKLNIFFFIAL
jgi:hypothetical protein